MSKYVHDFKIVENRRINDDYFVLNVKSPQPLPDLLPGQFVEIRVDNAPNTFLRRPISIYDVAIDRNLISMLFLIVGEGTAKLAELHPGDLLNMIYPLGNSFTIPSEGPVLLVGGGVGVAPLLFLGKVLVEKGITPDFLLGARSSSHLVDLDKFESLGTLHTTTEDGSAGTKGLVTQHPLFANKWNYRAVYTCGPVGMMKAVAALSEEKETPCEASLENTMACGFGACLCCIQKTVRGNICVCTEGPVFNSKDLIW
ncbi:MAG: dihydroorotate dehydrogenase electron transfer subunit [Bacteroidales bacterium]|nr:dihydroorotate dehydrogenase electron transfer subunit [Bacteroidales bacterium]